jgi:hypothetical protein
VEGEGGDFTRSRDDSRTESLTILGSKLLNAVLGECFRSTAHLVFIDFFSACSNHHACIYIYDASPVGLRSKRARRQILGGRLEQHRPEAAIIPPPGWLSKIVRVRPSYWRF